MQAKTRIGILGIGAVGGYFGGSLAEHYRHSNQVEIVFIPRPSTVPILRENGLKLITPHEEKIIRPHIVSSDAGEIGPLDVLICATKSYDLEESLGPLRNCITDRTLILPLLNGVDAPERIRKLYPAAVVLDGCVHLIARRIAPGVVRETGNIHLLYFGSASLVKDRLEPLQKILLEAGIDSRLSDDIEADIWEKFVFIAALASSTTYFDQTVGGVASNPLYRNTLLELIRETTTVARAKNIRLPDNIVEKTIEKIEKLPFDAATSMHSDFQKGGKTEYRSLTVYVADLGDKLNIETPAFDKIAAAFTERERQQKLFKLPFDHYTLRLVRLDDLEAYFNLIENNRTRLEDFFAGTVAITKTIEDTEIHLNDVLAKAERKEYFPFVVTDDSAHKIIASIQIKNLDWNVPKGELGYFIDKDYAGKRIVTQAVSRLIAFCFDELHLEKVFIRTHESNIPSRKVAENNGMTLEGILRKDYKTTRGTLVDLMYYGLVREEYPG